MVRLTYGLSRVELEDPDFPYTEKTVPKQVMYETVNGKRYVYDLGAKRKRWELKWNHMKDTQFLQLRDFIENTVNFKEIPFTFTDVSGKSYTVRCTNFSYMQSSPITYSVSIILEEEL